MAVAVSTGTRDIGSTTLRLAGLWCAGCASTIERALGSEPGVVDARVIYGAQRAVVTWDPSVTDLVRLVDAVSRAGYSASPDAAAPARALRQAEARRMLWRLFVAGLCMMQVMMYQAPLYVAAPGTLAPDLRQLLLWAAWLLTIPVIAFSAAPMFRDALASLRQRRIGMDVPVVIGIVIMFIVSTGATFDPGGIFGNEPYFDSLTMFVTFLLVGRCLTVSARNKVAATLENAVDRTPAVVRRLDADGGVVDVATSQLRAGDRVRVLPGEAFAVDGPLADGETEVDEALLTGESRPVRKVPGDIAIAGSINLRGTVVQIAERLGDDTRYAGIAALMRSALLDRPAVLRTADRVAGPFLWAVLLLAVIAALAWSMVDPSRAVWVAVSVLIVTCPCALSLAAPSALLAAAGALTRRGVLVQRLDALESLARVDTVCFDKTGTLTTASADGARMELQEPTNQAGLDKIAVLAHAVSLARLSTHPAARAIAAMASPEAAGVRWREAKECAGAGIDGVDLEGRCFRLGSRTWAVGPRSVGEAGGSWLSLEGEPLASFAHDETLRGEAAPVVASLRRAGLGVVLLSGDTADRVRKVAREVGIERAEGDATPADKLAVVARLHAAGHRVAMVGDGINDAPVMASADISFAMGSGSALTRSKADFTLMSGALTDIAWARMVSQRTMRIVRQNLAWAVAYNATCLPLAAMGWFPPWAAGIGMASSSLFVVLNSLRVGRTFRPVPSAALSS